MTHVNRLAGAVAGVVAVARYLLNPLFRIFAAAKAREVMTAAALLVVLGAALVMELGGLSMAMGAFLAGVLLSESSFRNQLEVPVLFYVLALLLLQTRLSDIIQVVLAWLFVLSRIGHAWVHTTTNDVRMRGSLWGIGALIVIVMWIWFAVRLLGASA